MIATQTQTPFLIYYGGNQEEDAWKRETKEIPLSALLVPESIILLF